MTSPIRMTLALAVGSFLFFVAWHGGQAIFRARRERRRQRLAGRD